GDLHFSSMEIVQRRIWRQLPQSRILLLDLSRVDSIDPAALESIERMVARLNADKVEVVFTGVERDGRIRRQLLSSDDTKLMFFDLDSALEASEESLLHDKAIGENGQAPALLKLTFVELDVARDLD